MFLTSLEQDTSSQEMECSPADSSSRVERTQVLVSTNHPRVDGARISPPHTTKQMDMNKDKEIDLPPQRSRTLSGRCISPMVPGAGASSSSVGPASPLPTGGEHKRATVDEVTQEAGEDPLALTFVECLPIEADPDIEVVPEEDTMQTPRIKRKARVSPGVQSLSEMEQEKSVHKERKIAKVMLRKMKEQKRLV